MIKDMVKMECPTDEVLKERLEAVRTKLFALQMKVTEQTLRELGADTIPMIYVFNKADLCGMGQLATIQGDDKIYMSAKTKSGIDALLTMIEAKLSGRYEECELLIPYKRGDIVSYLNNSVIYETDYRDDGVYIKASLSVELAGRYREYIQ